MTDYGELADVLARRERMLVWDAGYRSGRADLLDLLASDDVREAVAQTLINEGATPGNSIHSWRCEYPDQYGPCNCVEAVADAALAAVRDTLRGGAGDDE